MKKFLTGLACGVVLALLCGVIVFFAAIRLSERKPSIAQGSTLVLALEGEVPEQAPMELPLPFLEGETTVTVEETWLALRRAAADPKISAVVLEPRDLEVGWGKIQEIHADLEAFRKSGKPLYAYLRNPGTAEYYLATAADRIYMTPTDMLDVKGLRVELMYLHDMLAKFGVEMEVQHDGKYKDFGDMFTRTSMSPETREVMNQILDQYYGDLVDTISNGRRKQPAEVRSLIDNGPFLASQALSGGLVDSLGFDDQMYEDLRGRLPRRELHRVPVRTYLKAQGDAEGANVRRIAWVVGQGDIVRGPAREMETGLMTSGGMIKLLREAGDDRSIRGVILRIDSPGGDGVASDDILHEVRLLSSKKPVVISMGDVAASGGYFVAMSGDPIVAYPNTLTGSIGVVTVKPNLHGLLDKLGLKVEALSRGRYADFDSALHPMDDASRAKLQETLDEFYKQFVARVAEGRHRKFTEVEPLAQGRVWLGVQAKANGLVDDLGGLDRAIQAMRVRAKIPASDRVELAPFPRRRTIFELLMNRAQELSGGEDEADARVSAWLKGLRVPARAWIRGALRGGRLELMPYAINVK